jgi:predicted metallopeptidase
MPISYSEAPDVKDLVVRIVAQLGFDHVNVNGIHCYRSINSKSRRTVARIHNLSKVWQRALDKPANYLIEVISERYDKLSQEEKEKVVIHELLHIPKGFSGGFRPHKGYITSRKIDALHEKLVNGEQPFKS